MPALRMVPQLPGGCSRPLDDPIASSPRLEQCGGNLGRARTGKALRLNLTAACAVPGILGKALRLILQAARAIPGILEDDRLIITWSRLSKPSMSRSRHSRQHGYIAQWLEWLTADQQVPGSNSGMPFYHACPCGARPTVCPRSQLAWRRMFGSCVVSVSTCRPNKQGPDAHVAHRVVVTKFVQRAYWRAPSLSWAQTQPLLAILLVIPVSRFISWLRCLPNMTVWPSGLRRWLKAPVRKGVGSNPTADRPC